MLGQPPSNSDLSAVEDAGIHRAIVDPSSDDVAVLLERIPGNDTSVHPMTFILQEKLDDKESFMLDGDSFHISFLPPR